MSALDKPFIYSSKAKASAQPVNIEDIINFEKFDEQRLNAAENDYSTVSYNINFFMGDHGLNQRTVTWRYENESDRDDDYDAIVETVGTDVAAVS